MGADGAAGEALLCTNILISLDNIPSSVVCLHPESAGAGGSGPHRGGEKAPLCLSKNNNKINSLSVRIPLVFEQKYPLYLPGRGQKSSAHRSPGRWNFVEKEVAAGGMPGVASPAPAEGCSAPLAGHSTRYVRAEYRGDKAVAGGSTPRVAAKSPQGGRMRGG